MILSAEEPGMGNRTSESRETSVSVREVREVTYRLLCASGVSPGVASRAATMVLFSEVHHGNGLLWLYRQLDLIESGGAEPDRLRMSQESEGVTRVETTGTTVLVVGPPTLDLLCERAGSAGAWAVRLTGAQDLPLLREPAYRAASRGLVCGLFWSCTRLDVEAPDLGALLAAPESRGMGVTEYPGSPDELAGFIQELLSEKSKEEIGGAVREMVHSLSLFDSKKPEAVMVCLQAGRQLRGQYLESRQISARGNRALAEEWGSACAHGIRVDSEVWGAVYSASRGMLVPDMSEGVEDRQ